MSKCFLKAITYLKVFKIIFFAGFADVNAIVELACLQVYLLHDSFIPQSKMSDHMTMIK